MYGHITTKNFFKHLSKYQIENIIHKCDMILRNLIYKNYKGKKLKDFCTYIIFT